MSSQIITIERHIFDKQKEHPEATGTLTGLLNDMALAAKIIARETTRAGLVNILGASNSTNVYGERQQKLDLFAELGDLPHERPHPAPLRDGVGGA